MYHQEKPVFFARIEDIWADMKPDWFHVKLLVLQVPVAEAVWILRESYINGETFTMNGIKVRLEKVDGAVSRKDQILSECEKSEEVDSGKLLEKNHKDNVVFLFDRKKG